MAKEYLKDKILSEDEVRDEVRKLKSITDGQGFLYFFLNYIWVSHKTKGAVFMGENSYQWQRDAAFEFLNEKFFISEKVRQIGFSTLVGAYALFRGVMFPGQSITIVSIGSRESTEFLENVEFMYKHLPAWLKPKTLEEAKRSLKFKNGSKIRSLPNTPKVGRSLTGSMIILDEFGFYGKNAKKILGAAVPGLGTGLKTPFSNKSLPSQLFLISTLPDETEEGGNEYLRILHKSKDNPKESKFKLIAVDVSDVPEHQDPEWHAYMKETLGPGVYEREVLGQEISMFDNTFIPEVTINKYKSLPPIRMDFIKDEDVDDTGLPVDMDNFINTRDDFDEESGHLKGFWVWHNPIPNREYGIVVDFGKGVENDYSAMHVIDLYTNEQVAEFMNHTIPLERFKLAIEAVCEYYNFALLSVESTGLGEGAASYFDENYDNLYRYNARSTKRSRPGFPMSMKTRPLALAHLQKYLINEVVIINSIRLINEMKRFCFLPNGRIAAREGHDDLMLALAQYCILREENFFVSQRALQEEDEKIEEEIKKQEEETRNKSHFLAELKNQIGEDSNDKKAQELEKIMEFGDPSLGVSLDFMQNRKRYF